MKVNSHLRVSILLLGIDSIVSFAETVVERERDSRNDARRWKCSRRTFIGAIVGQQLAVIVNCGGERR